MSSQSEVAVERFVNGFSCSQAVFATFAAEVGLPVETALKIASPFAGGMGRRGEVCGAVTGALMVLGLARGHADNADLSKATTLALVDDLLSRFHDAHGAIICRDLIGHSMDTPEAHQAAKDAGVFQTICPGLVGSACDIVASILDYTRQSAGAAASQ